MTDYFSLLMEGEWAGGLELWIRNCAEHDSKIKRPVPTDVDSFVLTKEPHNRTGSVANVTTLMEMQVGSLDSIKVPKILSRTSSSTRASLVEKTLEAPPIARNWPLYNVYNICSGESQYVNLFEWKDLKSYSQRSMFSPQSRYITVLF